MLPHLSSIISPIFVFIFMNNNKHDHSCDKITLELPFWINVHKFVEQCLQRAGRAPWLNSPTSSIPQRFIKVDKLGHLKGSCWCNNVTGDVKGSSPSTASPSALPRTSRWELSSEGLSQYMCEDKMVGFSCSRGPCLWLRVRSGHLMVPPGGAVYTVIY